MRAFEKLSFVVLVVALAAAPAYAHKKHAAAAAAADTHAAQGESPAGEAREEGEPGAPASEEGRSKGPASEAPYRMPPLGTALLEHMHNKVVHFPVVLTLVAAVVLILARRKPELEPLGFWLVWVAGLSALAAYFSGKFQEEAFEDDPKEWLVEIHEKSGIAVALAQAFWVGLVLKNPARRYAWIWGLVVAALVAVAAFLGGQVAHGE